MISKWVQRIHTISVKAIITGPTTPSLYCDLSIGGSARTHLFYWLFLILIRVFLGCVKNCKCSFLLYLCLPLSLPFHLLLYHNAYYSLGEHSVDSGGGGEKTKAWILVRHKAARKAEDEGAEEFWGVQVQWMGKMKTGPENRKRHGTKSGGELQPDSMMSMAA